MTRGKRERLFLPDAEPLKGLIAKAAGTEGLLHALLEAADSIIFVKDRKGRYILANPALARVLRLPLDRILGRTDADLFPGEEAKFLRAGDTKILKTGETTRTIDRLTIDGRKRAFIATKVALSDERGKTTGILGNATEITDEIATREFLERLNSLLTGIRRINQLITKEKEQGRLLRRACETLVETRGYRSAWIVLLDGKKPNAFYHAGLGDDATSLERMHEAGMLSECARRALERPGVVLIEDPASECGECPLLGKAPEHRKLAARLEYEGKLYGLIAAEVPREYATIKEEQDLFSELAGDIGFALYRLELEAARRESEERFRSIVETSHAGIMMIDKNYRIVYTNEALTRIFGWERVEVIGHDFREFLDKESRDLVAERYRRRQAGEDVPARYEFNVLRRDGTKRRVEISSTVIRDPSGGVRTVAQILDITERRVLEERLEAIYKLGRSLILKRDRRSIARRIVEAAKDLIGIEDCALYLFNEERKTLSVAAYTLPVPVKYEEFRLDSERGIIPAAARSRESIYVPDITKNPIFLPGTGETKSKLCIPLLVEERLIGVLNAESPAKDGFSPSDRRLLEALAAEGAVALENFRLGEETARLRGLNERIVTTINEGIAVEDASGTITYINPTGAEMLGYSAEELVGKKSTFLSPEEERSTIEAKMAERRAGASDRYETTLLTKTGKRLPVFLSASPLMEGDRYAGTISAFTDITKRVNAEKALVDSLAKTRRTLDSVIEALEAAIDLRDPYTAGHQMRVAQLAVAIAREMGLPKERIEAVRYASLIHDIGKLSVPAEILARPSKLSDTEFEIIKAHPRQAHSILKGIDFPWPVDEIVLQHHERLDGSGYPNGLKGDEIMLEARILAVADVVEAMASHRPYRPAHGIKAALIEIVRSKGKLYDPDVVDACLTVFEKGFSLESD
ncbi:hypothetical protein DRJ24_00740 [Candidatus Acetothermia bacterium]|nr:MAG: hypothetical protein DRJ24_00740 [Candidatus Acetothermia bacterium]